MGCPSGYAKSDGGPLVSVLVPNYNGERDLEQAVRSGLAQTYDAFEIVIVDDGSTDRSPEILERLVAAHPGRIRWFTHPGRVNRGLIATYDLALSHAQGSIVAFLESDDVWYPRNLERKVQVLERYPEVGVVHGDYRPFGNRRAAIYWGLYRLAARFAVPRDTPYDALGSFHRRNPIPSYTHFIARRELLDGIPPQQLLHRNCDWWVLAHLSVRTRFYFVAEQLSAWRIHQGSSHYGPVRIPLGDLRSYLLALHESLLATAEVGQNARYREQIERVRKLISAMDPEMFLDHRRFLSSLRRQPVLSLELLADALVRRLLFAN